MFRGYLYRTPIEPVEYLALVRGEVRTEDPVLVRVQSASLLGDVLGATVCDSGAQLKAALKAIDAAGQGVLLYIFPHGRYRIQHDVHSFVLDPAAAAPPQVQGAKLRDFGLGAQVLHERGVRSIRLMTNNPKKIAGLEGYGLAITESIPILVAQPRRS